MRDIAFRDIDGARAALASIRLSGIPGDLLAPLYNRLGSCLAAHGNPDDALHYFSRFVDASRSPQVLSALFQGDPESLDGLLSIFRLSPWLAECLVADPEAFDLIRLTDGQPVTRDILVDEILSECVLAGSFAQTASVLRRHRRRETLRIAYGDFVRGQPLERTCQQLSFLADAILNAALASAKTLVAQKRGDRGGSDTPSVTLSILATGQYGGQEQDYGDALEILLLFDGAPTEFANQCGEMLVALLSASDSLGPAYELNQRLRPPGSQGAANEVAEVMRYYDLAGRTWHRHAFTRARVAAGDEALGESLLARLEPWVYRRYLGMADLEGLRSIKRKLARRSRHERDDDRHVETLRRTTHDIENVIQFLQLLNGRELPVLRVGSTMRAIAALEQAGCLTMHERTLLSEHYVALRRLVHRFQLAEHPPQRPGRPLEPSERVAAAQGDLDPGAAADVRSLENAFLQRRQVCRRIIDHLVHDVFTEADEIPFETEMVLDPDVDLAAAADVMRGYGFQRPEAAFDELLALAREPIRFLSDRRSRHFLAGIAPTLLEEIAATPDPDRTLERLAAVSDCLGGKAALWELFQTTPSALRLCARLCASSPYLTGILTNHPGMLDELIDSLVLDRLPQRDELDANAKELCRFAEDIDPILHSFKNSAHLRIGVRDVLGRDPIESTHRAIADTAEICLLRLAEDEWESMADRFGDPLTPRGEPSGLVMLALGRLGGREANYHSDLDVVFLYQSDGQTRPRAGGRREGTTNQHFFNELAQRISKRVNHYGPAGRLYELDARIRLSGHRGTMAVTIDQFRQHLETHSASDLWQRLALVAARVIFGSDESRREVEDVVRGALVYPEWNQQFAAEAHRLRHSLQQGAADENIKRGFGGTMDVEAIVQMLLMAHARQLDGRLGIGTLAGLDLLRGQGWISLERFQQLAAGYRYLRNVESNLRLMDLPARHNLPTSVEELRSLAFAMRESHASTVIQKCNAYRESNRQLFESIFAEQTGTAMELYSR